VHDEIGKVLPLISVVIPLHNGEKWIRDTLLSVSKQSYENIELVVIDDGSTDSSIEVIEQISPIELRYPIRIYRGGNHGVSSARNWGIKESRGDLIAFLDSDDLWKPDKLLLQFNHLCANPKNIAVICDFYVSRADSQGRLTDIRIISKRGVRNIGKNWLTLEGNGALLSSTILIWRRSFENLITFDQYLGTAADLSFYLKLSELGEVGHLDVPLVQYRQHSNQMHTNPDLLKKDFILLLGDMRTFPTGLSKKKILGNVYIMSSLHNLSKRRYREAIQDLRIGFAFRPASIARIPISIVYKRLNGYLRLLILNKG
jgi:glycosyltransferase involved in cell wall biosynthesis